MLCSVCRQSQCKMPTEQTQIQSYRSTCNRVSGVQGVLLKKVISPQQFDASVEWCHFDCMHFESAVQSADMTQEASMTPLSAGSLSPASGADCSGEDCVSACCPRSVDLHVCMCCLAAPSMLDHHACRLQNFMEISSIGNLNLSL